MRGVGHIDAIESMTFRHAEGNEGWENGAERGNWAFCGCKLLKRRGDIPCGAHEPSGRSSAVSDEDNRRRPATLTPVCFFLDFALPAVQTRAETCASGEY